MQKISIEYIKSALNNKQLPGFEAHKIMSPPGREKIDHSKAIHLKNSAVLILLYYHNEDLYLCLTKRNRKMKHHPGQISFPGGKRDKEDKDLTQTALRETHEEIGIAPHVIKIIGKLSLLSVPVSKFLIHPFVGYIPHKPEFSLNKSEVEELISIKLADILSQKHEHYRVETFDGEIEAPCYIFDKHVIWGATSMMIAELVAILKHYDFRREEH